MNGDSKNSKDSKENKENDQSIYDDLISKSNINILSKYDEVDLIFKNILNASEKMAEPVPVLGFDAEWNSYRVAHTRPISLIQISVQSNKLDQLDQLEKTDQKIFDTYLIKMMDVFGGRMYTNYCENSLVKVLESNNIYKVGVNICYDRNKLFKDYQIKLSGVIELGNLYTICNLAQNKDIKAQLSLANLTKNICGYNMPKTFCVRRGDWEKTLS